MILYLLNLFLLVRAISAITSFIPDPSVIRIDHCKLNEWFVRHYIVYSCGYKKEGGIIVERHLTPFACDPTNGVIIKEKKRPVFLNEEYVDGHGFVYECVEDKKLKAVVWRAKECFVNQQRFLPGHYIKEYDQTEHFCYKDLDTAVRIRVYTPVHDKCNPHNGEDVGCKLGQIQTILNSHYGAGQPFAYDPLSGRPIPDPAELPPTVAPDPERPIIMNLKYDRLKPYTTHLLRSLQGTALPSDYVGPTDTSALLLLRPDNGINNQIARNAPPRHTTTESPPQIIATTELSEEQQNHLLLDKINSGKLNQNEFEGLLNQL